MLASITSCGLSGIDGFTVTAEVNLANGMPMFEIVGLPDASVKESRERVRAALKNSGFSFPAGRITVNLAPADLKKEGPAYDLPIALGLLACSGALDPEALRGVCVLGELSLDGSVRPIRDVLPMVIHARQSGMKAVMVPGANLMELRCIEGVRILGADSLLQAARHLRGEEEIAPLTTVPYEQLLRERSFSVDFCHVKGQKSAKRALEIAAAGGHNVLMIGPPGSGKTLMARCMPTILPDMRFDEALETTRIHSVAGTMPPSGLLTERPFRSPHHTASHASLVGGGANALPGEISKAHNGVLFLDELPEYDRAALEAMRQPLEDGVVSVVRVNAQARYPARMMLVAAMNPCPCGCYGSAQPCRCRPAEIARYRARISGPLLDRIDLQLTVSALSVKEITAGASEEPSDAIRARVQAARAVQQARYAGSGVSCNAALSARQVAAYCALDADCQAIVERACEKYHLSMRAVSRIQKVARTIADLAGEERISRAHVLEALKYRSADGAK